MTSALNRRRFRFSLRTMFGVVTVLACWIGYELRWIQQRRSAINDASVVGLVVSGGPGVAFSPHPPPWHLRLFGEDQLWAHLLVTSSETTDADLTRLQSLFPELKVERQ
jgi:hypothetical protein